jgi:GNAT superfamily N-acetyltransferase
MTSADQLRVKTARRADLSVVHVPHPTPEINRSFYVNVGADWKWTDRLPWTVAEWQQWVDRPELQTWLIKDGHASAGYFELEKQAHDDVEIVYFGLLPDFVEKGIGGWALSEAVLKAWEMGAKRVWVHTCDLDHPRALSNYLARGFQLYKTETSIEKS